LSVMLAGSMPYFDSIPARWALPVSTLSGSSLAAWLAWTCWPWLADSQSGIPGARGTVTAGQERDCAITALLPEGYVMMWRRWCR
jgi:hypothetical protein